MTRRPPRVVGLDISLTSTGVAWPHRGETTRIRPRSDGHRRLEYIITAITHAVEGCDLAVVEGPSYASTGSTFHQLAGGWWLAVHDGLWRTGTPYAVASPSTIKMFATGNGGSKTTKRAMLDAARTAFPDFLVANHDEADALWAAALGCHHLGHPLLSREPRQLRALASVDWPPPRTGTRAA